MNNENLTARPISFATYWKYDFVVYAMSKLIFNILHDGTMSETYHFPSVLFVRFLSFEHSGSSISCSYAWIAKFIPKTEHIHTNRKKNEPLSTDNAGYV